MSSYAPWARLLRPEVELVAVQLPGRENRFTEPFILEPADVLDRLIANLQRELRPPYVILGHSMGGLLGYRLTQRLLETDEFIPPRRLIVSAASAPSVGARRDRADVTTFSDERLIENLRRFGGTPDGVLADPNMLGAVLPIFRADLTLSSGLLAHEKSPAPVSIPISLLRGSEDSGRSRQDADAWGGCSGLPISEHVFPGGHFYFRERLPAVVSLLNSILSAHLAA
jgi:medium-chain acyl-[acyl-carrier-protein] hydrolase